MNLFILSINPKEAAEAHGDKHVVKMVLEACQMLYSAHWVAVHPELLKERSAIKIAKAHKALPVPEHMMSAPKRKCADESGYRPVHLHHPCTIWIRECLGNYMWAVNLALALADEYEYRWPGRTHSCKAHALWLKDNLPPGLASGDRVTFAIAMDEEFRVGKDPLASYLNYYKMSKKEKNLAIYTRRSAPAFLTT
jgi:hypothetical protein